MIKSGSNGLKSKKDVLLGIFWHKGARDSVQDPQDPLFVKVGVVVVVNHENQWEENGK